MARKVGTGDYRYEEVEDWAQIEMVGSASDMARDSEDRVYVAQRTTQAEDDTTGVGPVRKFARV